MRGFITELVVKQQGKDRWQLKEDLVFVSELVGSIRVPAGFVTDFASVPRLPLAYLMTGGKANAAAVIHDWLYSTQELPRKVVDDVFYEAIRTEGHSAFTGWVMWLGVRVGGWWAWDKPNLPQPKHVNREMYGDAP